MKKDFIEISNVNRTDEFKQKVVSGDEVEIRFVVHNGEIEESVIMASGKGLIGFLSHLFYTIMKNNKSGTVKGNHLCEVAAISISIVQDMIEEEKTGGMN